MEKVRNTPIWAIILLAVLLLAVCAGLFLFIPFFLFGFGAFSSVPISVGPTFMSAERLATDVVFETTQPDAESGSIVVLQEEDSVVFLHPVLVGYVQNGMPESRLVMTRYNGDEYLVENGRPGRFSRNDDFRVETLFVESGQDTYVALHGEILNPEVAQIEILWHDHAETTATVKSDPFHTFLWFGLAPAPEAQPHTLRALDKEGAVLSAAALGP